MAEYEKKGFETWLRNNNRYNSDWDYFFRYSDNDLGGFVNSQKTKHSEKLQTYWDAVQEWAKTKNGERPPANKKYLNEFKTFKKWLAEDIKREENLADWSAYTSETLTSSYRNWENLYTADGVVYGLKPYKKVIDKWKTEKDKPKKGYYTEAQPVLDNLYSEKEKQETINLTSRNLKGKLSFAEYSSAETIYLEDNQLTELDVSACKDLKYLNIQNNYSLQKLIIYDWSTFERLLADTGKWEKSSIFGGKTKWEPLNVGHPNIAPLKITAIKKNDEKVSTLLHFSIFGGHLPDSTHEGGDYLSFFPKNWWIKGSANVLEINEKNPALANASTEFWKNEDPNDRSRYKSVKISWLAREREKTVFEEEDFIEIEEITEEKQYSFADLKNLSDKPYFLGGNANEKIYSEEEFQDLKDFLKADNSSNPFCQKKDCLNVTPNHTCQQRKRNNTEQQQSNEDSLIGKILSSPWTLIIAIGGIGILILFKWLRKYV